MRTSRSLGTHRSPRISALPDSFARSSLEGQDNDEVTRQVLTISRPISRSSRECAAQKRGVADIGRPGLLARVDLISRRTAAASERARRVAARSDPSHDFAATAITVERLMLLAQRRSRPECGRPGSQDCCSSSACSPGCACSIQASGMSFRPSRQLLFPTASWNQGSGRFAWSQTMTCIPGASSSTTL